MKRTSWLLGVVACAAFNASARAGDRVLVVPFNVLNVPAGQQWIGTGVQENLAADLGRNGGFTPIAFQGQVIVEDNATAARLARNAQAPLVIRGAAQVVGENVRLTAQLIDSKSGDTIRTALVTGPTGDLLKLEDELGSQLRGTTPTTTPATPTTPTPAVPVIVPAAQMQVIVITQPQPAYYPSYTYIYNYPSGYYPLVLYPGAPGNRGHGHERGGGDGGWHIVHTGGGSGGFNPNSLPIPENITLPILTNQVLPLPAKSMPPLPTNHAAPFPTIAPAVPRTTAGRATRTLRPPGGIN